MRQYLIGGVGIFEALVFVYFMAINSIYLLFSVVAFVKLTRHRRRWTTREFGVIMRSPATPAVSVIVPAHNEAASIGESVHGLLLLNYPQFEVIVVNDGSTDRTLEVLIESFGLVRAPASHDQALETEPVRGIYRSLVSHDITVIDKENGGKADALNAGLNAARHPLVCIIDADSLLDEHALIRCVLPFVEDPRTIATGGMVRVVNGCKVERGRVVEVHLPRSHLAIFQSIEYLRAFLAGRVAQAAVNGLLIISGAFGIFRRDAVLEAGGFRRDAIGEDMELVVRLHHRFRADRRPYRVQYQPEPVCWTEVPERLQLLARQRNRWQRGTMQALRSHLTMLLNPRYGIIGLIMMPYYLIFEALGPIFEFLGYVITVVALVFGLINWDFAELVFLAAVLYGTLISLAAVVLEEASFRRYPRLVDLLRLIVFGVAENFGFRQLTTWWRLGGVIDFLIGRRAWGAMTRRGFART